MSDEKKWGPARNASQKGGFERDTRYIDDRITADAPAGDPSPMPGHPDRQVWPVEAGRYRLIAARACPWAHRSIITRRLMGLEDALSMGLAGPVHDSRSWTFDLDPDGVDPVLGIHFLRDAYDARIPDYPKGVTVPAVVEIASGEVVTNDIMSLDLDLATQWREFQRDGAPDLYPEHLRDEMDPFMQWLFREVNNGVYRCGFAASQEAYDEAYDRLWTGLDELEKRLADRRYLFGDHITAADVRTYTTLARFDPVYHSHFKCDREKLDEMPVLWAYLRDLYQTPGFGDTTDFVQIKEHYYIVQSDVNPTGIVPKGPDLAGLLEPTDRAALGGEPFGRGTPPPPVAPSEQVPAGHRPV